MKLLWIPSFPRTLRSLPSLSFPALLLSPTPIWPFSFSPLPLGPTPARSSPVFLELGCPAVVDWSPGSEAVVDWRSTAGLEVVVAGRQSPVAGRLVWRQWSLAVYGWSGGSGRWLVAGRQSLVDGGGRRRMGRGEARRLGRPT
jgi:hypothetical protein